MTLSEIAALEAELVGRIADGIVIAGPDGVIVSWNDGAAAIFGYSAAEAVGQRLDLIIPQHLRSRHWDGFDAAMDSGETRYGDRMLAVPATHRDGRRLSIEFRVALLGPAGGKPRAIGAVIRDVTERWCAERDLRARVAELEAAADSARRNGEGP